MKAGENVIIRPTGPGVAFVQLDDLNTPEQLERVRPAACIIHATSPGNYQVWIAVSGVPDDKEAFRTLVRRVRKAVGVNANDKSASARDPSCRARRTSKPNTARIFRL